MLRLFCLLTILVLDLIAADPICSDIFGHPSFNDCGELAVELFENWPGESERFRKVSYLKIFSLRGAAIPEWIGRNPRYNQVDLPKFAGEGKSFHDHRKLLCLQPGFVAKQGGCLMALMPLRGKDGQVAVDIASYNSMSRPAQLLGKQCIRGKKEGGFTHVGMKSLPICLRPRSQ